MEKTGGGARDPPKREPLRKEGESDMNENKNGLGFWGVVGAVLVALIIFSFCG